MNRAKAMLWLFCCTLPIIWLVPAGADIYMRDEGGVPVFSDRPDRAGFNLFLRTDDMPALSPARKAGPGRIAERMRIFAPMVDTAAREQALEPALLHAVVMVESGYDPGAISNKGAVGLMQLMPQTAERFGATNRKDPEQSLRSGARYLSELLRQFDGNLVLALAAYNAGENAVRRWGMAIPPFHETQRYVSAVLARYNLLRQL